MATQLESISAELHSSCSWLTSVRYQLSLARRWLFGLVPGLCWRAPGAWRRRICDAVALIVWAGLYWGLIRAFYTPGWTEHVVSSREGYQTVLQVIPAALVTIFGFVLGSVLVIAQLVSPSRGSRSVRLLLVECRLRGVVAGTLIIALGGILLAGSVPPAGDPGGSGVGHPPGGGLKLDEWPFTGAAALAVLSSLVLLATVVVLGQLCHRYCTPSQFSLRLARFASWGEWPLIEATKAWRQWLCTAARDGASRDLLYACETAVRLAHAYLEAVERHEGFQDTPPKQANEREAGEKPGSWTGTCPFPERSLPTVTPKSQAADAGKGAADVARPGWYVGQLSKALVRATEEGARADITWRNLDELLATQERLLELMLENDRVAEAEHVLHGMAETCCLAQQAEAERTKKWFARAWLALSVAETTIGEAGGIDRNATTRLRAKYLAICQAVRVRLPSGQTIVRAETRTDLLPPWVGGPTGLSYDGLETGFGSLWIPSAWSVAAGVRAGKVLGYLLKAC